MMKAIAVAAIAAAIGAGNASACSDLGFLNGMTNTNKQVTHATNSAIAGNYSLASDYVSVAKQVYRSAPAPCGYKYKLVRAQYGVALDYLGRGLNLASAGSFNSAMSYVKQSRVWLTKATQTLRG